MRLSISHDTTYHYEDQVRTSIQYLRMTPHDSERQQVLSWELTLPRPVRAQLDPYGNILHVLTMDEPHESIVIGARGQVEIDEAREAEHESQSALPFLRFTRLTEADEALREFAKLQSRSRPDRSGLIDSDACPECAYPLPAGRHRRGNQRQRGLRRRQGRLSGSRPRLPRLRAQPGHSVALCVGLSFTRQRRPPGQPRLGRSLAGRRLVQL